MMTMPRATGHLPLRASVLSGFYDTQSCQACNVPSLQMYGSIANKWDLGKHATRLIYLHLMSSKFALDK
jgi:hypothetical protein